MGWPIGNTLCHLTNLSFPQLFMCCQGNNLTLHFFFSRYLDIDHFHYPETCVKILFLVSSQHPKAISLLSDFYQHRLVLPHINKKTYSVHLWLKFCLTMFLKIHPCCYVINVFTSPGSKIVGSWGWCSFTIWLEICRLILKFLSLIIFRYTSS